MFRLFAYKFLVDFWIIVPVIVPFYKAHGMNATRILTIQAAYSCSQLLFEIPSGYLSDVIGRRRTLILAAAFMIAGIGIYACSGSFGWFIIAETVLGLAGALRSGTDSAILYDYLLNVRDEHRYKKFEGLAEFWSRTGTAVSSIAGGLIGAYVTLRLPFYVNMVSASLMLLVGISLREPQRKQRPAGNPLRNIVTISFRSVSHPALLSVMLQMGLQFSVGVTAVWGYFLLYRQLGLPLFWHGIIFAAMQLTSAFSARHAGAIESKLGHRFTGTLLWVPGILLIIAGLAARPELLLPMVFMHAAIWGLSTPLYLGKLQTLTTSDIRATTLSVCSMAGRILTIAIGPAFGWWADRFSVGSAFTGMGGFLLVTYPLAALLAGLRRNRAGIAPGYEQRAFSSTEAAAVSLPPKPQVHK
jgi:MFS family permease